MLMIYYQENFIEDYYNELLTNNYDLIYGNLKIDNDQLNLITIKSQTSELILNNLIIQLEVELFIIKKFGKNRWRF